MRARRETGEGRLSSLIWLVVIAGGVYAGWHVLPLYYDHYTLKDRVIEVCRVPRGTNPDEKVLDMLVKVVQEQEMAAYISRRAFRVQTGDTARRIYFEYEREGVILPGWKKVFHFQEDVNQPLLW